MRAPSGLRGPPFITPEGASLRSTMSAGACHFGHFVQASNAGARFANANASVEPPSTPGGRSPSGKAAWCRVFGRLSEGANGGVGRQYL